MVNISGKRDLSKIYSKEAISVEGLLFKYAKQFPGRVVASVLLGFSGALFNGVGTALLFPVLLQILGQDAQLKQLPPILRYLNQPFEAVPEQYRFAAMLLSIVGVIGLKVGVNYINTLVNVSLRRKLMNRIRESGFRLLLDVDITYFDNMQVGDIIRRIDGESSRSTGAILSCIRAINLCVTILVFTGFLISLSWPLTLASSFILAVIILPSQFYNKRAKKYGRQLTEKTQEYAVRLLEVLSGMRLIRTIGSEDREYNKLLKIIYAHEQAEFSSQMNSAAIGPINEISSIVALICIIFLGRLFFAESLDSFSLVLPIYLIALFRLTPFIGQINVIRNQIANKSASIEVLHDFLRSDNKPFMPRGGTQFSGLRNRIEFKGVDFHYPGHRKLVLKNVNLSLPKGQTLALVGGSGSGKSTLADLLARFYDPTEGQVTLDGIDLRDFDLANLRASLGVVSQDTFLFNDTVRNNILYAKPDATDQEVIDAAKRANAYDFVMQLPQNWETLVGDRGVMLSGGQRQRLAIARVMLQDPEILILDEATSALDTVSERLVQKAIDELSQDRTILVIAHRLSTVRNAHQIAVLDQGKVVEVGNHEELFNKGGKYRELCEMQFGHELEKEPKFDPRLAQASYNARTNLNSMLGSLSLISEDLIETEEEKESVLQDVYRSARNILQVLESIEQTADTQ